MLVNIPVSGNGYHDSSSPFRDRYRPLVMPVECPAPRTHRGTRASTPPTPAFPSRRHICRRRPPASRHPFDVFLARKVYFCSLGGMGGRFVHYRGISRIFVHINGEMLDAESELGASDKFDAKLSLSRDDRDLRNCPTLPFVIAFNSVQFRRLPHRVDEGGRERADGRRGCDDCDGQPLLCRCCGARELRSPRAADQP